MVRRIRVIVALAAVSRQDSFVIAFLPEISMTSLLSALLILAGIAAPAHMISDNPVTTALRGVATSHGKAMLAAAKLMPADKYDYKPRPAQRSFGASVAATGVAEFPAAATRNGEHDFDFEIGRWKIDMKRLEHPLSGSTSWISPKGYTHIVQIVWGGRAGLALGGWWKELAGESDADVYPDR